MQRLWCCCHTSVAKSPALCVCSQTVVIETRSEETASSPSRSSRVLLLLRGGRRENSEGAAFLGYDSSFWASVLAPPASNNRQWHTRACAHCPATCACRLPRQCGSCQAATDGIQYHFHRPSIICSSQQVRRSPPSPPPTTAPPTQPTSTGRQNNVAGHGGNRCHALSKGAVQSHKQPLCSLL